MQNKPRTVVFCLPGNSFGGKFLERWTDLLGFCFAHNIRPLLSQRQSCNIYYVRNMCLGADVMRGKDQKPFDGKLDYDFIIRKEDLVEVAYTGMGFMLVKRGVFEKLEYPWFRPIEKKIGDMVDFTMEDVAFCLRAKEAGFKIFIDPAVKVGHEKNVVL